VEASFQRKGKSAEQESVYPERKNLEKTDEIGSLRNSDHLRIFCYDKTYSRIFTMISRLMAEAVTATTSGPQCYMVFSFRFVAEAVTATNPGRFVLYCFSIGSLYGAARALTISGWMVFRLALHTILSQDG
jgi:hypothetical protein